MIANQLEPLLRKLESEAPLSNQEREAVRELSGTIRSMTSDHDIVGDKERPTQCCVVLEGWLCRYKILESGKRQILSFHIPGEMPDLQSLFLKTMDHHLGCATWCKVAFIPHQSIATLVASFPRLAHVLWRETLIDAAIFRQWIIGLGCRQAPERIAHLFCELFARMQAVGLTEGDFCKLPLTQAALADALGLSTVHVNRSIMELRASELISLDKQILVIPDWDAVRRVRSGLPPPSLRHL